LDRYIEDELSKGRSQVNNPLLVTLDHNCIIALEKDEENADAIRQLIAFHQQGIINIVIGWSTMFEKPPQGEKPLWFPEQEHRLRALGLGDVEQFKHQQAMWFRNEEGYSTYIPERAYYRTVHEVLFPSIDFGFQDYLTRYCQQHHLDIALYQDASYYSNPMTRVYTPPAEWEQRMAKEQEFTETTTTMQTLKKIREKWMNAKNDSLGLCAHVSWKGVNCRINWLMATFGDR
jgi:hypothetical protein